MRNVFPGGIARAYFKLRHGIALPGQPLDSLRVSCRVHWRWALSWTDFRIRPEASDSLEGECLHRLFTQGAATQPRHDQRGADAMRRTRPNHEGEDSAGVSLASLGTEDGSVAAETELRPEFMTPDFVKPAFPLLGFAEGRSLIGRPCVGGTCTWRNLTGATWEALLIAPAIISANRCRTISSFAIKAPGWGENTSISPRTARPLRTGTATMERMPSCAATFTIDEKIGFGIFAADKLAVRIHSPEKLDPRSSCVPTGGASAPARLRQMISS